MDKQESPVIGRLDEPQLFQNVVRQTADLPRPPAYLPYCVMCLSPPAALSPGLLSTLMIAHLP